MAGSAYRVCGRNIDYRTPTGVVVVVAVVVVAAVVKTYARTSGLPINPQPRPIIVICRSITIVGKYKTNISEIQIEVTIRKSAPENAEGLFIYIGVVPKGAKRDYGLENERFRGAPRAVSGKKRPEQAFRGKNRGVKS